MNLSLNKENNEAKGLTRAVSWLWRLFSSMKLAVILLLMISGLSLMGTFIAPVRFFQTWWFLAPGILLMLNIIICSINRWKSIKAILQGGKIKQPESFFTAAGNKAETIDSHLSPAEVSPLLENTLKRQGYRVRSDNAADGVCLAADKNRYFRLGTYLSHLSLIIFVLAYLIGSIFGFRDTNFIVIEGETREVGHNTALSLNLISFTDEYYTDNTPMDYRSEVVIYENGQEADRSLIRVNHPLAYAGIRFYQSFFGPAVRIQLKQNGMDILYGNVALAGISRSQGYQRPSGYLDIAEAGLSLRFISPAVNAPDPMIAKGQLAVEVRQNDKQIGIGVLEKEIPLEIGDMELTYQEDIQFSGFQVSHDPGNILIWIASTLFFAGMIMVLFFPYQQLWLYLQSLSSGKTRIFLRLMTRRGFSNTEESKRIRGAIEKSTSRKQGN